MNAGKRGLLGGGALIALVFAAGAFIGVGGMAVAHHDEKDRVKTIAAWDIVEKLDGKETKVTVVEVTLKPGQGGEPQGRVLAGVLEVTRPVAIDQNPELVVRPLQDVRRVDVLVLGVLRTSQDDVEAGLILP